MGRVQIRWVLPWSFALLASSLVLDSHPCVPHCRPWCGPKKRWVEVEEVSKSWATRIAARGSMDKTRYILFFLVLDRDVFYGRRSSESGKTSSFLGGINADWWGLSDHWGPTQFDMSHGDMRIDWGYVTQHPFYIFLLPSSQDSYHWTCQISLAANDCSSNHSWYPNAWSSLQLALDMRL